MANLKSLLLLWPVIHRYLFLDIYITGVTASSSWSIDRDVSRPPRPPIRPLSTLSLRGNGSTKKSKRKEISSTRYLYDEAPEDDKIELVVSPNKSRTMGTKELLVIRIEHPDGLSTTASAEQLFNDIFDDEVNLVNQYERCSNGKLNFVPAQGLNVRNGIATLQIDEPSKDSRLIYEGIARNSEALLGKPLEDFDEVMLCMPPETTVELNNGEITSEWIAFVPGEDPFAHFLSVFSDGWCSSVSAGMHEIGHTLGLQHANEAGNEYEDTSGQMGFSTQNEFGPRKCFNPSNSWHLGWYSETSIRVNPILDAPFRTTLVGVVNSENIKNSNKNDDNHVILQIPHGQKNIYIGYNHAEGYNEETPEGRNMVLITEQNAGGDQRTSLLAKLGEGDAYTFPNYIDSGKDLTVKLASIIGSNEKKAIIDVYFEQDQTSNEITTIESNNEGDNDNVMIANESLMGCDEDQVRFEVTLITDAYASDSSWELAKLESDSINIGNAMVVAKRDSGTFRRYETHDDLLCIDRNETYSFTVFDSYGDGLCCSKGWGSYSIFVDGKEIVRGGEFGHYNPNHVGEESRIKSVTHVFRTEPAESTAADDNNIDTNTDNNINTNTIYVDRCEDDPSFQYRENASWSCDWVAVKKKQRCRRNWRGKPVTEHCPVACNVCSRDESNENETGDNGNNSDRSSCTDDPFFMYKGKRRFNCSWVAKKKTRKKCKIQSIADACPFTCGTCTDS